MHKSLRYQVLCGYMNKPKVYLSGGLILIGIVLLFFSGRDADQTASVINELVPEKFITHGHGLAVDVRDASSLYIATHHGLLVLKNEKDLYRIGASHDDYMGFTPHPNDSNVFYSSGHPQRGGNLGFQKSEDGGFTWKKLADGIDGPVDFHAMAVSPINPNLLYGWYQGNLQRSQDEGKTWEIVNRDLLIIQLTADSQDENVVYIATPDGRGVQVSRDKGVTWQSLSPELEGGQVAVISVNPGNSQEMFVFAEKIGGLGKTIDGGKTWNKVNEEFESETVLYISYDKSQPKNVYLLTHKNAIYKSTDGGGIWVKVY